MKRIKFLLLLMLSFSAFVLYLIITNSDPYTASTKLKWLFYLASFCLTLSLTAFVRFIFMPMYNNFESVAKQIFVILRQSVIVAAVVDVMLIMQSLRVLTVLDCMMIIASAFLFELFFWVRVPINLRA